MHPGQSFQNASGSEIVEGVQSPKGCVTLRSSQTLSGPRFACRGRGVMTLALPSSQGCGEGQMGELLRLCRSKKG